MSTPGKGYIVYRKQKLADEAYTVGSRSSKNRNSKPESKNVSVTPEPATKRERIQCGCGGSEHDCFSNSMGCGRLLCTKEGEGPCFHCGTHVVSVDAIDKVPLEHSGDPEFIQAIELRDRLLAQDANYAAFKMKVHDLHTDWFREAHSVYNEDAAEARMQYYKQEAAKRAEKSIQRVDIDLQSGKITRSSKRH
ncbi:putative zinc finger motif C2HC5-type family protein [Babesia bovis T2Bo]|uniref:putative zinc finger motif C2HC5-type family protein n=1 Tax=Babesia bovis T2Bo TaxID=484906 RepID=UPI001C34664D|nr:putative zinc finger motif C2HC5-type family protein [Babesia bovis T2Bo]EDO07819.2 putative zinc finger motif C2HC5-type family protein [Babesia bovis T2Bo]